MTGPADFRAALDDAAAELDDLLLPSAFTSAACRFLGTDGASLGVLALDLRVPLGASDPPSTRAEQLQFTTGEGPCLTAIRDGVATMATADELESLWPMLADAWSAETPFRSAASLPVDLGGASSAALNLFYESDVGAASLDVSAAAAVVLEGRRRLTADGDGSAWLSAPAALRRQRVWVALGVVMMTVDLDAADALARLRSHAVVQGRALEDVVESLLDDPTSAVELTP